MRGQASRGVWQPIRAPPAPPPPPPTRPERSGGRGSRLAGSGVDSGVVDGVGSTRNTTNSRGGGGGGSGGVRGRTGEHKFKLAADNKTAAAAAGDVLSDSESEDDEDDTPMLTPADARTAFDGMPLAEAASNSEITTKSMADDSSGAGVVNTEGVGGGRGKCFARDIAMEVLGDKRRKKRISDAERLANRMDAIGAEVRIYTSSRRRCRWIMRMMTRYTVRCTTSQRVKRINSNNAALGILLQPFKQRKFMLLSGVRADSSDCFHQNYVSPGKYAYDGCMLDAEPECHPARWYTCTIRNKPNAANGIF